MAVLRFLGCLVALASLVLAQEDVVHVGILHSQTGTLAISEISVIQAELMAIDEINAAGGVLGKKIVPVIRDGASDGPTFAAEAQKLVSNSSIVNVFGRFSSCSIDSSMFPSTELVPLTLQTGCWTSASRKAVKPVFEASKIMLWYPVQYEGQECSPSIIYSGAAPNQQLEPAVRWLLNTYPDYPFFLLGSDYVFPRTANSIIKAMLNTLGRPFVAERYCVLPRNEADQAANSLVIDSVIEQMKTLMPNGGIVFNTLNGDANVDFFTKLNNSGLRPDKYPTLSVSISETEVSTIGVSKLKVAKIDQHHLSKGNYFMTDPDKTPITDADFLSRTFIRNFWKKYNDSSLLLNDPMESAYINVHVWALAVEKAQTFAAEKVRQAAYNLRFDAPQGTVSLRSNHHFAKYVRIGKLANSGRFDVVFETLVPVQPEPWNQYIDETRGYICDHRVANGSMYKPPSISAVLLYRQSLSNVLDTQRLAIDQLNSNNNGIEGKLIVPTIINLDWPQGTVTDAVMNLTKSSGIDVVFGTSLTTETWEKWTKALSIAKAINSSVGDPLTYIPPDFKPPCSKNIIFLGLTARQIMQPTFRWLQDQNIFGVYFVGEDGIGKSAAVFSYLNATMAKALPNTQFLGNCNVGKNTSSECFSRLKDVAASMDVTSRIVIINSISTQNAAMASLFSHVSSISALRGQKIIIVTTSSMDKSLLTLNMTGHFSVGSYFSDISLPQNAVFRASLQALYGRGFEPSEAMEKIYTAIVGIYNGAVRAAKTLDADRVRIVGWAPYFTPAGEIAVNKNNLLSAIPRVAQVINVGGYLKYRLVFGDLREEANLMGPAIGEGNEEGEQCYFGPTTVIPSSFDVLRIVAFVLTTLGVIFCIAGMVWVTYYRKMLVIRHAGLSFLLITMGGCLINFIYIYVLIPVQKVQAFCTAEFWPLHLGFILVFSCLLQKVYAIFQSTQRKRFLKGQKDAQKNFWIQVSAACFVFFLYMILRSIFEGDVLQTFTKDIIPGVLVQKSWSCEFGVWEWAILGLELLMVVIGIALALQVRDVPSAFNESFDLGVAIYIWAFFKILTEVFLLFMPYDFQVSFALKAFGEIIPSLHSSITFLWPQYKAISSVSSIITSLLPPLPPTFLRKANDNKKNPSRSNQGKGNEIPRIPMTSFSSASDSSTSRNPSASFRKEASDADTLAKPGSIRTAELDPEALLPENQPFLGKGLAPNVMGTPGIGVKLPSPRGLKRGPQDGVREPPSGVE
ncbi:hypothetical protein HDU67_007337 [Dinochytrium kinnereticum]|nr:hypothetical protein HDU67_007337 [Dinochytrium kinnereticum]